jgi:hypothetical protein
MASGENGEDFVAQLLVAHALARLWVVRGEQHRQEIVAIGTVGPALGDETGDKRVEGPDRGAVALGIAPWKPSRKAEDVEQIHALRDHLVHQVPHRFDLPADIAGEHRARDDGKRQRHHFGGDVERLAPPLPTRGPASFVTDHRYNVHLAVRNTPGGAREILHPDGVWIPWITRMTRPTLEPC